MTSLRKVWIITNSLLLSQLRAAAASRRISVSSIIRRPLFLAIIDLAGFAAAAGIAYYVGTSIKDSGSAALINLVSGGVKNVVVILPAIILSIILVLGLVLEVSSGAQFASSDTVNWLPVTASEYVSASTLSLLIYYSIYPLILLSATLSLSYVYGILGAWGLAALLSIFGIMTSASILEILRAVLNRFSTSFYRRGGRAAIGLRALSGVVLIIIFQSLFYPTVYEHFLGVITSSFGPTWLVPILWASVAVTAFLNSDLLLTLVFSLLAVGFSSLLFFFAIEARSKYWVPMQPSVRISSAAYAPKNTGFVSGILSPAQLAIARKDLRGLVRRRDMVRLLAMPGVFLLVGFLGFSSGGGFVLVYFGLFIVGLTTLYFSELSVGSEGKSLINLYQAPVTTKDFVVGKIVPPIVFGSGVGIAFYVVIGIVFHSVAYSDPLFLILCLGVAVEMSLLGLLFGLRFPNFAESPRAAYVSQTGGILAFFSSAVVGALTVGPFLFTYFLKLGFLGELEGFAASLVGIGIACYLFYRLDLGQAYRLLSQFPTS